MHNITITAGSPAETVRACIYDTYRKESLISTCAVSVSFGDKGGTLWGITDWRTIDPSKRNRGYGAEAMGKALSCCLERYGEPVSLRYIWNGANDYVLSFIERHFDARCMCPAAVLKANADDDKESHIYELDAGKVFGYFGLRRKGESDA